MTPLEKQIIINKSLKDFVYFKNTFLKPEEVDEFIKRIQEGSETMYIRNKINESISNVKIQNKGKSRLKLNDKSFSDDLDIVVKFKPKNGANIDIQKILKDNEQNLKI